MAAQSSFFATLSRMRYIERWSLMRSSRPDTLAEHSLEVAMIAHALAVIGNVRHGKALDANRAALLGIYHDAPEIITGDMPTPVKYHDEQIRRAYKDVEAAATERLLDALPSDLRPAFEDVLAPEGDDAYLLRLVKAADKVSALVKCIEEKASGNTEFVSAEMATRATLSDMARELPELKDFMYEFLPAYGATLDELLN